jgi:hypothetical protein
VVGYRKEERAGWLWKGRAGWLAIESKKELVVYGKEERGGWL